MNDERRLSKTTVESKSDVNVFENLSDFGFAKKSSESNNIRIRIRTPSHPETFGRVEFEMSEWTDRHTDILKDACHNTLHPYHGQRNEEC